MYQMYEIKIYHVHKRGQKVKTNFVTGFVKDTYGRVVAVEYRNN